MDPLDRPPDPDPQDMLPLDEGGPLWMAYITRPDGTIQVPKLPPDDQGIQFFCAPDRTRVVLALLPWPKTGMLWITPRVAREWGEALITVAESADNGEPRTQATADEVRRAVAATLLRFIPFPEDNDHGQEGRGRAGEAGGRAAGEEEGAGGRGGAGGC